MFTYIKLKALYTQDIYLNLTGRDTMLCIYKCLDTDKLTEIEFINGMQIKTLINQMMQVYWLISEMNE